jgi:hypothetical protein
MDHQTDDGISGPGALSSETVEASIEKLPRPVLEQPAVALTGGKQNEQRVDNSIEIDERSKVPFSKARCIALVATVTGASFLNALSTQSVVIILPTIGKDLDIPVSRQQWLVSSYSLAFGCFLLIWGRIADIYGKRLIFILGSAFVIPVTAINPLLPNEIAFNLFRGLQGFVSCTKEMRE